MTFQLSFIKLHKLIISPRKMQLQVYNMQHMRTNQLKNHINFLFTLQPRLQNLARQKSWHQVSFCSTGRIKMYLCPPERIHWIPQILYPHPTALVASTEQLFTEQETRQEGTLPGAARLVHGVVPLGVRVARSSASTTATHIRKQKRLVRHGAVQSVMMMAVFSILATPCTRNLCTTRESGGRQEPGGEKMEKRTNTNVPTGHGWNYIYSPTNHAGAPPLFVWQNKEV